METKHTAVRTKTGSKVHLSTNGSSRTNCGIRYAMTLKQIPANATPCQGCGMAPEMTANTLAQWIGLPLVGAKS